MPAFSREAYEMYDKKAKTAVRAHLDRKGIFTNVYEDYGPDIQAVLIEEKNIMHGHLSFHEVEVKVSWKDEWPEHWKTLHIPARKRKHLNLPFKKSGCFWVLNESCTKAKVVVGHDLKDEYLENIPNVRSPKGEYFFSIPIELTSEVILKGDGVLATNRVPAPNPPDLADNG
jgi:hypothetical protein